MPLDRRKFKKNDMTHLIYIIFILVLFLIIYFLYNKTRNRQRIEHEHTIVQHEVKDVFKLILVESFHTDIQTYTDIKKLFIGSSEKKATLIIRAKVLVGYDLTNWVSPIFDKQNRKIILDSLPKSKILAIDHDTQWYDIDRGLFNKFTPQDFTNMERKGKGKISKIAESNGLLNKADEQIREMLYNIEQKTKWKIEVKPSINQIDNKV